MTVCVFPSPGQTLQVLNTCSLERREEVGPSSAFTTGSSCTCRKSWDTLTTRATASTLTHPRYDATVLTHWWEISHPPVTKLNVSLYFLYFFFPSNLSTFWTYASSSTLCWRPNSDTVNLHNFLIVPLPQPFYQAPSLLFPFAHLLSCLLWNDNISSFLSDCSQTRTNTSWRCSSAGRTA